MSFQTTFDLARTMNLAETFVRPGNNICQSVSSFIPTASGAMRPVLFEMLTQEVSAPPVSGKKRGPIPSDTSKVSLKLIIWRSELIC
jgi:hypothetical protein